MLDKDLARFWTKVHKGDGNSCWVWQASCLSTGMPYGQFSQDGGRIRTAAHRAIFEHEIGRKLTVHELVCHKCDNPPCVRFDHLFLGSYKDNAQDMHQKGRFPIKRGNDFYGSKLTEESVMEIRRLCFTTPLKDLASRYGVSPPTISYMLMGRTWKHLGPVEGWKKKTIRPSGPRKRSPELTILH